MPSTTIPLLDLRRRPPPAAQHRPNANGFLQDRLNRPLADLRISVTDRCNFRCSYCMPKEVFDHRYRFLPSSALLSFEEITRLARVFIGHGVRKLRLTGGEPLLRKHLEVLVGMLAALRTSAGAPLDITLTTNGSLLARKAAVLAQAGLKRVTVSLDALDDTVFKQMNDVDFPVAEVLQGIDAALAAGLGPIKVNMVVKRGVNDDQVLPMAAHFRRHYGAAVTLRFIEFMDVGATNGWKMKDVVPSSEILQRIGQVHTLEPVPPHTAGETAQRWRYRDGQGEIGLISSVTRAFCQDCNRARLSTEGQLYLCLFAHQGHDLRSLLRAGADDAALADAVAGIWAGRGDRYSELRAGQAEAQAESPAQAPAHNAQPTPRRVEMHYIGG
jgi:cyclic pyranopterin phosphate synthase